MQDDLRQGPKNVYFVDTARDLYLKAHTFFVCPGSVKILIFMWPINLSISVAWQALTMQIFFNLKIMIPMYILWGIMTILASLMWFTVRDAWIQNTPDKNKCFWSCLIGTVIVQTLLLATVEFIGSTSVPPTEKVKIIINSNIPRDSIELIVNSNYEAYSTDLP